MSDEIPEKVYTDAAQARTEALGFVSDPHEIAGQVYFRAAVRSAFTAGRAAAAEDIEAELQAETVRLNATDPKKVSGMINNWLGGIRLGAKIARAAPPAGR